MAEDNVIDVADAIVTALNAVTSWSMPFQAKRTYYPIYKLEEEQQVCVFVAIKADDETVATRASVMQEMRVDVAVMRDVDPKNNTEVDRLVQFVREIKDVLRHVQQTGATWLGYENSPMYDAQALVDQQHFRSVVTSVYKKTHT